MPAVSRQNDALACGDKVASGSPNVFVNGLPVARLNDPTTGHDTYVPNKLVEASSSVKANGLGVARVGDKHLGHNPTGSFHQTALTAGASNTSAGG